MIGVKRRILTLAIATTAVAGPYPHARGQSGTVSEVRAFVAAAAYEKHDYAAYLQNLLHAAALRPTHPIILYRLAGAHALNGDAAQAAAVLQKLARLSAYRDVAADKDFASILRSPQLEGALADLDTLRHRRIGSGVTAHTISDPAFIPEGIAYDRNSRSFFVSSQYKRKIVRIDDRGVVGDFVSEAQDGIWMVFGIAVDPARGRLWAVSTADPAMKGFEKSDEKRAGLFAFDLSTGRLVQKIVMEPADPAHYFDDLTIGADGRVFLSDGGTGTVYTLAPNAKDLSVLVERGTIQGPNGLTLSDGGRRLYVSDYAGFIFAVDPATGAATRLPQPEDATLYGIDGLSWHRGTLVGIQNGVEPNRIVRLHLADGGLEISKVEILEMNNPAFEEPTLAVVVDDAVYCVANSHGGVLRRSRETVAAGTLSPPAIVKVSLR